MLTLYKLDNEWFLKVEGATASQVSQFLSEAESALRRLGRATAGGNYGSDWAYVYHYSSTPEETVREHAAGMAETMGMQLKVVGDPQ